MMSFTKRLKSRFWHNRPGAKEPQDPKPMAIPAGFNVPITLEQRMQQLLSSERLRAWAIQQGHDTPEEFDDFGEDDHEGEPQTDYELVENPSTGREMTRMESQAMERRMKAFDREVNAEIKRRKAVAKQKKAEPSKGFQEEVPAGEKPAEK